MNSGPPDRDYSERAGSPERLAAAAITAGTVVCETYLVKHKEIRTTKSGKPFMKLRVGDRTGTIDCVVWESAESLARGFDVGDLVEIQARASEYRGNIQLEASDVRRSSTDRVDARTFLPATYRDVVELQGFLQFHVDSVYDAHYGALLGSVFGDRDFMERFTDAPAAKTFHHAYLGGLLEHTVAVADLCDHVSQQYGRINRDLLITSALLHDVGKVQELTFERTIDYSEEGRFLGHVILGVTLVSDKASRIPSFPEEKLRLLLHAIVSHHGELEWGSPKRPKTIEALILHHVDNLDAKVKGFLEIVEGSRDAEWTDLRNLFRRPLHVPKANHQEPGFLPPEEGPDSEGL